ncbi:ABC transporter permease [Halobacterium noricense]|uniref:ABC transporter permease n=1 Tax=Halobacterium noricense TaxID=223182 RepID=UPI001E645EE0|nr:ABC transporter permease [Halobacterium noricense]UHH24056.1 ABC transporter permease [Halobacterium noricense]
MSNATVQSTDSVPESVRRAGKFVFDWIPLAVLALLWEYASGTVVPAEVLPSPSIVAGEIQVLIVEGTMFSHLFVSLYRIGVGLGLSIAAGVLLGIGMARLDPVENFFEVLLALTYPIPKTALVPLAILWLGVGTETAVLIVFLACLLPIVMNAYNAAENVDQNLVWAAKMMGTEGRRLFVKVIIPATIPDIMTGIRQAVPIAFIALVSAELIASDQGIGYLILTAGQIGNYPTMFANIVVISAVAYFAVRGFEILRERVLVWT